MVVVTLGCRPRSPTALTHLHGRVKTALEEFDRTDAEYILFTGGTPRSGRGQPECSLMSEYALQSGVDPGCILLEDQALDTIGNGYFSRLLIDSLDDTVDTVTLVTSDYHLERASFIFEQCFGPQYVIVPVAYDAAVPDPDRHEYRSFQQARTFFEGIRPGDVAAIGRRLEHRHDCYSTARIFPSTSHTH